MMLFCQDFAASKTAVLLGINRNTINRYFNEFRLKIATYTHHKGSLFLGKIELDESWMNRIRARRVKGKWDREAAGQTPVFCVLKRGGNVFVEIVQN